ncbi:MAG: hypothetical protein Q8P46_15105 [Hyphomicrobiales bacterium]|nr:hypothetical protein [Hyphomicrobiales bacterium]
MALPFFKFWKPRGNGAMKVELTITHQNGSTRTMIVDAERMPDGETLFRPPVELAPDETCTGYVFLGTPSP